MIKTKKGHCDLKGNIPQLCAELSVTVEAVRSVLGEVIPAEKADALIHAAVDAALECCKSKMGASNDK